MMKRYAMAAAVAASLTSAGAFGAVPAGYYDSLEGLSGVELKQAVKALVAVHTLVEYGEPTWKVFEQSDTRTVGGALTWFDMYSANNMRVSDGHPGLNIEHSVPNSWWGGVKNGAYMDVHHLNPANATANGQKSNYPLGEITGAPAWTNDVTTIGSPKSGQGGGSSRVFEPADVYKGDFARAYFYVFTVYDTMSWDMEKTAWMYDLTSSLTLRPWAYDLLLQWGAADPVSHKEMERNDAVFEAQANRNPFIDCPQLADHIWGSRQDEPFHYALYTPADDDPEYPGWDGEAPEFVAGQWQPVTSADELDEQTDYFIVAPYENRIMATEVINKKAMDECFYSPVRDLKTYPDVLTGVPQEAAVVRLERNGDGWNVAVYDLDGDKKGYLKCTSSNSAVLTAGKNDNGTLVTITAEADRTKIDFTLSDGAYTLQYNSNTPRFAAYKSSQKPAQLYRACPELLEDPADEDPEAGVGAVKPGEPEVIFGIFDLGGRRVGSDPSALEKGVYIVVGNFGARKIRK